MSESSKSEKNEESTCYESNSMQDVLTLTSNIFSLMDIFSKDDIENVMKNPIYYNKEVRHLSRIVYNKNGLVSNAIDYMVALPSLDRVLVGKTKNKKNKKIEVNKELMENALTTINEKQFIRDVLHTDLIDGISFYYFEVTNSKKYLSGYMDDIDVENIIEINDFGLNISTISLDPDYTKIVGKKNNRYVIAFDLKYFSDYTGEKLENKLKKYPKEIREGYLKYKNGKAKQWIVLDNNHTFVHKIKSKTSEAWGRPVTLPSFSDIFYQEYFINTKRAVLDEINNKIIYETFPEGEKKGKCSLSETQQKAQHKTVKDAIMNKNSRGGTSFISLSAGTKLNVIDTKADILDEKMESNLNDQIAMDLGIATSLLNGSGSGNYSSQQNNLQLLSAQIFQWVDEISAEITYLINKNIIKDKKNEIKICYLPITLVNRKEMFGYMKDLYTNCSGSLSAVIAASGMNVEAYLELMDNEKARGFDEKYTPHATSYNTNVEKLNNKENKGGRPETDNPTQSTIVNRNNNANDIPSASDNK